MIQTFSRSLQILKKPVHKLPWGWSTSLDIKNCNSKKIKDREAIKDYVYKLCDLIEMKRFGPCHIYKFGTDNKAGYSMLQLIETSNIVAHFVEETDDMYLDVFSCKKYDPNIVKNVVNYYFRPIQMHSKFVIRQAGRNPYFSNDYDFEKTLK